MPFNYPNQRVLLFAKEPVLGQVKTRLHEAIGAARAYELHCALLRYQVNNILSSRLAPIELWIKGNPDNPVVASLPLEGNIYRQEGDDLGQRMQGAVVAARSRSDSVTLIGTDCPSIDRCYLQMALDALATGKDLVVGPAEDGGYVLLGVSDNWPILFNNIPWGTDRVLSHTLERVSRLDLDAEILPTRWDVDRPQDLLRLHDLDPPIDFDLGVL